MRARYSRSRVVAEAVIESLNLELTPAGLLNDVEVQFVPNSDVLQVTARASSPEGAADLANAMVEEYSNQREAEAAAFNAEALAVRKEQLTTLQGDITAHETQLNELIDQRAAATINSPVAVTLDGQIATLRGELPQLLSAERELQKSIDDIARVEAARQPAAEVIRLSEPPESPSGIPTWLLILGGTFAGFVVSLVVSFLVDRLDRTARDEKSLQLALGSNVLGEIPSFGGLGRSGSSLVMMEEGSKGSAARAQEAIRRLRSAVQFVVPTLGTDGSLVLAVSSAYPGEGKSTTAANLSVALAQNGSSVVLVSGDMRRPTIESIFNLRSDVGLSTLLGGADSSVQLMESGVPNLWIVPSGPIPRNPSELLGVSLFDTVIKELRSQADFVIIDTPPLLSVSDGLVIGSRVDGVVIVVDARTTDVDDLLRVRAETERSGSRVIGGVLNRDSRRHGAGWRRDRYAYNYTSQPAKS